MSEKEYTPLDCPCGNHAYVEEDLYRFYVFCEKCGSCAEIRGSEKDAVEIWNEQVLGATKNGYNYLWDYNEGYSSNPITECPCGEKNLYLSSDDRYHQVRCLNCDRTGYIAYSDSGAISSWEEQLKEEQGESISQEVNSKKPQKTTKTITSKIDSSKNELNLCSCGGTPRINETESGYKVICQICGKPGKKVKSKEVAISKWNDANS